MKKKKLMDYPEKWKRRTQSAADAELSTNALTADGTEIAPPDAKVRRKSYARQARLVVFPTAPLYPNMVQGHCPYPQMMSMMPQYQGMPQMQNPPPIFKRHSITFNLYPGRQDIRYNFKIEKKSQQIVKICTQMPIAPLTFSINQIIFHSVNLPVDVTDAMGTGINTIMFVTTNQACPICVEMRLIEPKAIDDLLNVVITAYPSPPKIKADIFSTSICPLTNTEIDKAARGVQCLHHQCFDLRSFIERGLTTENWVCPVCGKIITIEDIRYDPDYVPGSVQFAIGENSIFYESNQCPLYEDKN